MNYMIRFAGIIITLMFIFHFPSTNREQVEVAFPYDERSWEDREQQTENKQTVVLELFTSQGCSSCPSADEQLNRLIDQADSGLLNVVALSFHVDYWNQLGWRDPFSHAAYSERQRNYRPKFGGRVYTPQLIINGQWQMVGSQPAPWPGLKQALKTPVTCEVSLEKKVVSASELAVSYQVSGPYAGLQLHLALLLKRNTQSIPLGENEGRTLTGKNIVMDFQSQLPDRSGTGEQSFSLPKGYSWSDFRVVAFLQHPESLEITGATQLNM